MMPGLALHREDPQLLTLKTFSVRHPALYERCAEEEFEWPVPDRLNGLMPALPIAEGIASGSQEES